MEIIAQPLKVQKRFALTISRGTTTESHNLWLRLQQDGIEGWGEVSPFDLKGGELPSYDLLQEELARVITKLAQYNPAQRQQIEKVLDQEQVTPAVKAGIDLALWDWWGKKLGLPLWRLWGLDLSRIVPISVTVGISEPEQAKLRVREWQKLFKPELIKVKLGSTRGIEADQRMLLAVKQGREGARLMVDANGGWNWQDAVTMVQWLAEEGVEYVEQPLAVGEEGRLKELQKRSPLPIFLDESCLTSKDLVPLADSVAGVNIKLMKAGGITEVWRMIHIAKALGLKVMYGCYSDTCLANTGMSHLAPLADYLDLDSHLNLLNDPFRGARLVGARLIPPDLPGLGVTRDED